MKHSTSLNFFDGTADRAAEIIRKDFPGVEVSTDKHGNLDIEHNFYIGRHLNDKYNPCPSIGSRPVHPAFENCSVTFHDEEN
ncbi:MAG TPA: hypothetical protein VHV10_20080 [Ktedonobacteraceae bacterium]|jgi:hypothetical protein|nr:hypothetical protein [Ktedonobacteraceae bacterium]